jgi:glycosyltransferase involved in cell wall biosynthesis
VTVISSPTPLVSIVVATYNAASTLERCIQSIITQTFLHWEIVISDGGSTDETVDIIRRYQSHVAYWHSHSDSGIYHAWNQALEHAHGDYICFLGADDVWSSPDSIRMLMTGVVDTMPEIISAKGQLVDELLQPRGTFGHPWDYAKLKRRIEICHPGAMFRHDLFHRYGKFDVRYRIVGDYEWLLRLPSSTTHRFIDQVVVKTGDAGVSRSQIWLRLSERREAHSRCPRVGPVRACAYWLDKVWRMPIARLLRLHY